MNDTGQAVSQFGKNKPHQLAKWNYKNLPKSLSDGGTFSEILKANQNFN